MIFDDAGVSFDAGRYAAVRVDQHDDGWLVRGHDRAPAFFPAGPHGLLGAVNAVRALVLQGPRRPTRQRDVVDLFTRSVEEVDAADVDAIRGALLQAWVKRARALQPACGALFDARATKRALVLCGSPVFLREPWLLQDALRFRAARAVLLDVDTLAGMHPSLPLADRLAAARRWRQLLAADGDRGVRRALNATIEKLAVDEVAPTGPATRRAGGEEACARLDDDIRALRFVSLVRPVQSLRHLALLGEMVRAVPVPHRAALGPRLALVQLASDDDLADVFDDAAAHFGFDDGPMLVHSLAVLLARGTDVPARGGLVALTRAAFAALVAPAAPRVREPEDVPVQRPPIPPPEHPGITFLSTSTQIFREGANMHHCVATRIPYARDGRAYLFHVDHGGARATIEVDRNGVVVEAQGPCNRDNVAARFARAVFARWGLGFLLSAQLGTRDGRQNVLLSGDDPPPLLPGERLVATLGELLQVLPFVTASRGPLVAFVFEHLLPCRRRVPASSRRWLLVDVDNEPVHGPVFTLFVVDQEGRVVGWPGRPPRKARRRAGEVPFPVQALADGSTSPPDDPSPRAP